VTVVHAVEDNAHSLPGGDESSDTNEPAKEWDDAPATAGGGECDDEVGDQASSDGEYTKTTSEDDTRTVAVADRPSNEVGVRLSAKGVLDGGDDGVEGGWVGSVLEGVKKSLLLTRGKVEFAWRVVSDVDGDDAGDLIAVWLCGDCDESQCRSSGKFIHL
jgi:hypothetical protein